MLSKLFSPWVISFSDLKVNFYDCNMCVYFKGAQINSPKCLTKVRNFVCICKNVMEIYAKMTIQDTGKAETGHPGQSSYPLVNLTD